MNPLDCLFAAVSSLRANPLRTGLTTLGIVIGVAAVVATAAVGAGAQHSVEEAMRSIGSNLLVVVNGNRAAAGRQLGRDTWLTLDEDDAAALARELPSVELAASSVAGYGQVVHGNRNWATALRGVTPDYFLARNWTIADGRSFTPAELRKAERVALLGTTVIDKLFAGASPLGRSIRVKGAPFTVIGTMRTKGPEPWGADQDDVVFMPLSTAKKRVFGGRQLRMDLVGQITVKAASAEAVETAEREIRNLLRMRHRIAEGAPDDFTVRNVAAVLDARVQSARIMSRLLASVAGISLLVGGVGVMNIMLVSVTERTREIGLRMAVGAKRRDVMLQFLTEALALSAAGGLVGVAVGVAGSALIARVAEWPVLVGPQAVLLAVLFSAAVGVVFGYYPARKAGRLDPIEALRRE